MPLQPPGSTSVATAPPRELRVLLRVANRTATGAFNVRGPYLVTRTPVSGQLQFSSPDRAGQIVVVDERFWMPLDSEVKARSRVTNVLSSQTYDVIYTQDWPTHIEAWAKRAAPQA